MWLFMYLCYGLMALSFTMLFGATVQGYAPFPVFGLNHAAFSVITIVVYLAAETLIMFFFVGTGVSVRDYIDEHGADPVYRQRMVALKRRLYPPTMWNMLFVFVAFVSGGAVNTTSLPAWVHGVASWLALLHLLYTMRIQHQCFRQNTEIILNMCGIQAHFDGDS